MPNEGINFASEIRNTNTCSIADAGGNYNRYLILPTQDSSVSYCWERCSWCNNTANPPSVTTGSITAKTATMVTVGNNNFTATGGSTVFYKGLLVTIHTLPRIYNNTFNKYVTFSNPTTGLYSAYISGLNSNVQYYVRAFASNAIGTTYGAVIPFVLCDTAIKDTLNLVGCNSLVYNGNTYTASTIKGDTLKTTLGCDSIFRLINISIYPIPTIVNISSNSPVNTSDTIKLYCDTANATSITWTGPNGFISTLKNPKITNATLAMSGWYFAAATNGICNKKDSVFVTVNNSNYTISGRTIMPNNKLINNALIKLNTATTNSLLGSYSFNNNLNGNYKISATKNNDIVKANGVNSVDVLLIQRHILNTSNLNSAYKIIAADVDGNKAVNSVDVLRLKRLILGSDTTFKNTITSENRLWSFVDSAYQFPDSTNPFPFKDSIYFAGLTSHKIYQTFIGVKLGDVNYDWNASVTKSVAANNIQLIVNSADKLNTNNNNNNILPYKITVNNFKDIAAMQYTLHFNNTQYEFIRIENNKFNIDFNAAQANATGNIAMLWTDKSAASQTLENDSELFTLVLKQKGIGNLELGINNEITTTEAWDNNFDKHNIVLVQKVSNKGQQPKVKDQLVIYPNPSNGNVTIKTVGVKEIEIIDLFGRVIKKQIFNNQSSIIKYQLKAGIYIVKATTNDESVKNEKLIVE